MAKQTRIKRIKKCLLNGNIYITDHAKERMGKRGYNNIDVIRGILSGNISEVQKGYDQEQYKISLRFVIEGKDESGNPIVVVVSERLDGYALVTVMPPTDSNRFIDCI